MTMVWPFDAIGYQVSRAGNAIAENMGKARTYNPDDYDFWGVKKPTAQAPSATQQAVGNPLFNTGGFNQGIINNSGFGTGTMPGVVNHNPGASSATFNALPKNEQSNVVSTGTYNTGVGSITNAKPGGPLAAGPSDIAKGPAITPAAPTATSASSLDADRLALAKNRDAEIMKAIGAINGIANPYDINSPTYKAALGYKKDAVNRRFNTQEARTAGSLSPASSGLRAALANNNQTEKYAALSSMEGQMIDEARTGASDFALRQQSAILNALGGSPLDRTLADLASSTYGRDRDAQNDQRMSDAQRDQVIALIAKLGIENADKIIKMFGGG